MVTKRRKGKVAKLVENLPMIVRRTAAGLSHEALSKLTKLHSSYLSMIETGRRVPSPEAKATIDKAIGTELRKKKLNPCPLCLIRRR